MRFLKDKQQFLALHHEQLKDVTVAELDLSSLGCFLIFDNQTLPFVDELLNIWNESRDARLEEWGVGDLH